MPSCGSGEELPYREPGGIEEGRRLLERFRRAADLPVGQRAGLGEAARFEHVLVAVVRIRVHQVRLGELGHAGQFGALPPAAGGRQHGQPPAHVLQRGKDQVVAGPCVVAQRGVRVRLEQHGEFPLAGQELLERGGQQRAGRVGDAAGGPGRPGLDQQPFAVHVGDGVLGHRHLHEVAAAGAQPPFGPEELDVAHHEVPLESLRRIAVRAHPHIVGLALVDDGRLGQRGAAAPLLHQPRVPG